MLKLVALAPSNYLYQRFIYLIVFMHRDSKQTLVIASQIEN